jgi:SAM-dependent methyltransferase
VSARAPGAAWQQENVATGFLEERRGLIPLWDVQEELARRLLTNGGRTIRRFCDLGAGDGGFAELVMDSHPGSTCVLVDFSEPMIAAAEQRLGERRERWEYVRGDLSQPAWRDALPADEQFDAVISRLCIHHLPDERKRALYAEVLDLLEAGGAFVNWEHVSAGGLAEGMFEHCFMSRLLEAERESDDPRSPEEVRGSYDDARDDDILAPAEAQCRWLEEIGFEGVEIYFKVPELAIFGGTKGGEPWSR